MSTISQTIRPEISSELTSFRTIDADGVRVFYRQSGPPSAPAILLLHGFGASSHMFRDLIPRLATRYRVIAPDLPGFGFTTVPEDRNYKYSFEGLARTAEAFVDALGLQRYSVYVFDYGAPTGFRLALAHPERVTALISQNGNAYVDGLGAAWDPIKAYWKEPTKEHREALRNFLSLEATHWQYTHGVPNPEVIAPESYTLAAALMAQPGNAEIQLDLFLDYASNIALYPKFQAYFRDAQPPTLVIWGKNDPFFIPPGAEAFRRDNPKAIVRFLDTGHFVLETHVTEVAAAIDELLAGLSG
jgi:pimeloyl-ACP methyl ester carboxylesterase